MAETACPPPSSTPLEGAPTAAESPVITDPAPAIHITRSAVGDASLFIKHVEVKAAMSNSLDILTRLKTPDATGPPLAIGQITGFDEIINYVLDAAEARGFKASHCSIAAIKFPVFEVIVYETTQPLPLIPTVHKKTAEAYFANPNPNTVLTLSMGNDPRGVEIGICAVIRKPAVVEHPTVPVQAASVGQPPAAADESAKPADEASATAPQPTASDSVPSTVNESAVDLSTVEITDNVGCKAGTDAEGRSQAD